MKIEQIDGYHGWIKLVTNDGYFYTFDPVIESVNGDMGIRYNIYGKLCLCDLNRGVLQLSKPFYSDRFNITDIDSVTEYEFISDASIIYKVYRSVIKYINQFNMESDDALDVQVMNSRPYGVIKEFGIDKDHLLHEYIEVIGDPRDRYVNCRGNYVSISSCMIIINTACSSDKYPTGSHSSAREIEISDLNLKKIIKNELSKLF